SKQFLWNAGMFCFTVSGLLAEMAYHCSDILASSRDCLEKSRVIEGQGVKQIELDADGFHLVPENSIDYALMEKSEHVSVVPGVMGWSDIGSWSALGDLVDADADGNRIHGDVILQDVRDCFI